MSTHFPQPFEVTLSEVRPPRRAIALPSGVLTIRLLLHTLPRMPLPPDALGARCLLVPWYWSAAVSSTTMMSRSCACAPEKGPQGDCARRAGDHGLSKQLLCFDLQLLDFLDGLNRCGLPGLHSLEPPSVLEMLEHRAAQQDAIVQNLTIQNRQLLASHQCLRQDRHNTEKEIQMIQADFGDAEALSDMQTREMVGKIRIMEAEIRDGAAVKKELHQVHLEADKLRAKRQELTTGIQKLTEEVEKVEKNSEGKNSLPELHAELDGLQIEYRSLRSVFEYKRDINTKQVEQMRTMEKNLIAMTKEADKLRAEVQNAKMRAQASAGQSGMAQAQAAPAGTEPYGSAYNNLPAAYQQATQACQSGMAHPSAPSAGIYHYASAYAYFPAAACQQATQAGPYAYAVPYEDANPMAYHQAVEASGYPGYPVAGYDQQHGLSHYPGYPAGYDQNALSNYPAAYAAPQHSGAVNGGPASATDAANMYNGAGCPAREVQTSGGTVTVVAQAADPPSDGAYHPTPTGGAGLRCEPGACGASGT